MKLPKGLEAKHIELAMAAWPGTPKANMTGKHLVKGKDGIYYPAKLLISLAARYLNGEEWPLAMFSGGTPTNNKLTKLGFEVVTVNNAKELLTESNAIIEARRSGRDYLYMNSGDGPWATPATGDLKIRWVLKLPYIPGPYAEEDAIASQLILAQRKTDEGWQWLEGEHYESLHNYLLNEARLLSSAPLFEIEPTTFDEQPTWVREALL